MNTGLDLNMPRYGTYRMNKMEIKLHLFGLMMNFFGKRTGMLMIPKRMV